MRRELTAAVDSLPLSLRPESAYDYTGLQLTGLMTTPLNYFSEQSGAVAPDGLSATIDIPETRFWETGRVVSAESYAAGIQWICDNNPFFGRFLLRNLKSLSSGKGVLTVTLNRPCFRILEILGASVICPRSFMGERSSGDFLLKTSGGDRWEFQRNPYQDGPIDYLRVLHIETPEENLEAFEKGTLDITSDTAFPFDSYRDYSEKTDLHMRDTGLQTQLVFGRELAQESALPIRKVIQQAVRRCDFDGITKGLCKPLYVQNEDASDRKTTSARLVLAYDAFYPNRLLCEQIARSLEGAGFQVEMVEDNYYAPAVRYDLKLTIERALGKGLFLKYAALLFSNVVRESAIRSEFGRVLQQVERTVDEGSLDILYAELSGIVEEIVPVVPVLSIPSISLVRGVPHNPLLGRFGIQ